MNLLLLRNNIIPPGANLSEAGHLGRYIYDNVKSIKIVSDCDHFDDFVQCIVNVTPEEMAIIQLKYPNCRKLLEGLEWYTQ